MGAAATMAGSGLASLKLNEAIAVMRLRQGRRLRAVRPAIKGIIRSPGFLGSNVQRASEAKFLGANLSGR